LTHHRGGGEDPGVVRHRCLSQALLSVSPTPRQKIHSLMGAAPNRSLPPDDDPKEAPRRICVGRSHHMRGSGPLLTLKFFGHKKNIGSSSIITLVKFIVFDALRVWTENYIAIIFLQATLFVCFPPRHRTVETIICRVENHKGQTEPSSFRCQPQKDAPLSLYLKHTSFF
jgi:hypothetical protein